MKAQVLTENREQIIEMIEKAIYNSYYEIGLREVMIEVKEAALMPIYNGMEDMKELIAECIKEIEERKSDENRQSAFWLEEKRKDDARKNLPSSMR